MWIRNDERAVVRKEQANSIMKKGPAGSQSHRTSGWWPRKEKPAVMREKDKLIEDQEEDKPIEDQEEDKLIEDQEEDKLKEDQEKDELIEDQEEDELAVARKRMNWALSYE
jgi:hypothetical protein